jgi:colanic acid/amylovoran biosynthesis glycosyltransferase
VVEDGVTGRLFPAGDVEALRSHIVDMVEDSERARTMGQAGRKKVEAEFNPDKHYQAVMEVYRSVL